LIELAGTLRNGNQLELVLIIEIKDILLVAFQQKNSTGQKPSMSRVGDVVITRRLSLAEY
jgi:hypothetical protein